MRNYKYNKYWNSWFSGTKNVLESEDIVLELEEVLAGLSLKLQKEEESMNGKCVELNFEEVILV